MCFKLLSTAFCRRWTALDGETMMLQRVQPTKFLCIHGQRPDFGSEQGLICEAGRQECDPSHLFSSMSLVGSDCVHAACPAVTFVALGNGAPDLSANITAIRSGDVLLSAGALTGGAMFVQCIVAAELVAMGGGAKCGGAMMRDVGVYSISIFSVLIAFTIGRVSVFRALQDFVIRSRAAVLIVHVPSSTILAEHKLAQGLQRH